MGHGTPDAKLDFNMPAVTSGTTYTAASDQASTDVIDLMSATADVGTGSPVYVRIHVGETAVTQTGTVIFSVQQSSDNGDSDAFTDVPGLVSETFTDGAGLTAGATILEAALPKETERYLRVFATVATGNITAGSFEAFLTIR